ncbi:hypothetical protein ACIBQ1_21205 [Nonomuraea sp. NPDC050153]|uniref:hypothetical protein n=1 Tax=Nonomuraea sp. NPDC050153 TaxID=3364359 RepID=UPI00379322B0
MEEPPGFVVDAATGRTVWRLPGNSQLIRLDDDGSRVLVASDKSFSVIDASGTTTTPLPARLRAVEATGTLTPNGTGQAAQIVSRNFPADGADIRPARLVTIDTGTGKVLHDVRLLATARAGHALTRTPKAARRISAVSGTLLLVVAAATLGSH